jgi:hypothetical protein
MKSIHKNVMFLASMILTTIVACTKAPKTLTLKAECFITTKASDNIKMGGVEVVVLDGSMIEFSKLNQSYTNVFAPVQKALNDFVGWSGFVDNIAGDTNKSDQASSSGNQEASGISEKDEKDEKERNLEKIFTIADSIAWQEIKKENPDLPLRIVKQLDKLTNENKEIFESHNKLVEDANKVCSYKNQLALIFNEIKDYEVKRTRTDAEGKIEINLPIKESYVIIAQSDRMVSSEDNKEKYFWIIRTGKPELGDENEIKIQMSNYNLSNMNEEEPEESTEERLILKSPKVSSMASGMAIIRKLVISEQINKMLNN